jgi:phospholipase C
MESPIDHVIVLMLENRSFNHLLTYSGIPGLTGVNTARTNPDRKGRPVALSSATPDRMESDPGHEFEQVDWQIYGAGAYPAPRRTQMNGFANKGWLEAMSCASPALVPVFTDLARRFVVCDNWFSSMPGPTWPNRFFVHAGSSGGLANSPSKLRMIGSMSWSKVGFSFEHGTVFAALARAGRTWRVYHGDHFPQLCAIDTMPSVFVASPDQFRKMDELSSDVLRGDVANYTFIEPDYAILSSFRPGDSQHPCGKLSAGEQLINTVASAVMHSDVWMSSLLVILYDEHGGFYDELPPPTGVAPPGDKVMNEKKADKRPKPPFGFDRLGVRVPAVVVSPWVTPKSVSHTVYDHASVIRTVFEIFGLEGHLTERDRKAASLGALIGSTAQTPIPEELPMPEPEHEMTSEAEAPSDAEGPPPPSLDGFVRIAAQVHHALQVHQAAPDRTPQELHEMIAKADADLSYLPGLPLTGSPEEARAYIARVASLMEEHRLQQRAGLAP